MFGYDYVYMLYTTERQCSNELEKEQLNSVKIGWNIPSKIRKLFQPLPRSTKLVGNIILPYLQPFTTNTFHVGCP